MLDLPRSAELPIDQLHAQSTRKTHRVPINGPFLGHVSGIYTYQVAGFTLADGAASVSRGQLQHLLQRREQGGQKEAVSPPALGPRADWG
jgi:hypothetical protein